MDAGTGALPLLDALQPHLVAIESAGVPLSEEQQMKLQRMRYLQRMECLCTLTLQVDTDR